MTFSEIKAIYICDMINLNFASNLSVLADRAIAQLKRVWTDPFQAPVIVFPDKKIEQWFRLKWVDKFGAVGNLNATTVDVFLWNSLQPDANQKLLTDEILQSVILAYFLENAKTLPKPCQTYLQKAGEEPIDQVGVKGIDEAKAFDLSQKLSALFRDYELTRPNGFMEGWREGLFFANNANASIKTKLEEQEKWQREIYIGLFQKQNSYFNQAFAANKERTGSDTVYLTLPYLFTEKKNNLKAFSNKQIFIFGLSSMGQFYHAMLYEMSQAGAVINAYVQNPCSEFWEDATKIVKPELGKSYYEVDKSCSGLQTNYDESTDEFGVSSSIPDENNLLVKFGKSGRENIRLWCTNSDYIYSWFGREIPCDSKLHALQNLVYSRKNKLDDDRKIEDDLSFTLTGAPTRLREVEDLHSRICSLLDPVKNNGAECSFKDILVLSPCLDEYRAVIPQVFESAKKDKGIPYKILDSKEGFSFTAEALQVLLKIRDKHDFNREDLFALLENPVVQECRGITGEDVFKFRNIISNVVAYRRKVDDNEDVFSWKRAVKRLLLSNWMDENYMLDAENGIAPFDSMDIDSSETLMKLVDALDSLDVLASGSDDISTELIDLGENATVKRYKDLEALREILVDWLRNTQEPTILSAVFMVFHNIEVILDATKNAVPFKFAYHAIMDSVVGAKMGSDKLFIDGISFMRLAPNRIVPAKHIFILGMGSEYFPGRNDSSTLDLRLLAQRRMLGDDTNVAKNRYLFLCEIMSAQESFHLSYINKDLREDAELDVSTVIHELKDYVISPTTCEMRLDEYRSESELYTNRGYRNRKLLIDRYAKNGNGIGSASYEGMSKIVPPIEDKELHITANQLKNFLKNPFEFYARQKLHLPAEESDVTKDDFEPVKLDGLASYSINQAKFNEVLQQQKGNWIQESLQGCIPASPFDADVKHNIEAMVENQCQQLIKCVGEKNAVSTVKPTQIKFDLGKERFLIIDCNEINYLRNDGTLYLYEPVVKIKKDTKFSKILGLYVTALVLLAQKSENGLDGINDVVLLNLTKDASKTYKMDLSKIDPLKRLREICDMAYGLPQRNPFKCLIPADFVWKVRECKDEIDKKSGNVKETAKEKQEKLFNKTMDEYCGGYDGIYDPSYFPQFELFGPEDYELVEDENGKITDSLKAGYKEMVKLFEGLVEV